MINKDDRSRCGDVARARGIEDFLDFHEQLWYGRRDTEIMVKLSWLWGEKLSTEMSFLLCTENILMNLRRHRILKISVQRNGVKSKGQLHSWRILQETGFALSNEFLVYPRFIPSNES